MNIIIFQNDFPLLQSDRQQIGVSWFSVLMNVITSVCLIWPFLCTSQYVHIDFQFSKGQKQREAFQAINLLCILFNTIFSQTILFLELVVSVLTENSPGLVDIHGEPALF